MDIIFGLIHPFLGEGGPRGGGGGGMLYSHIEALHHQSSGSINLRRYIRYL